PAAASTDAPAAASPMQARQAATSPALAIGASQPALSKSGQAPTSQPIATSESSSAVPHVPSVPQQARAIAASSFVAAPPRSGAAVGRPRQPAREDAVGALRQDLLRRLGVFGRRLHDRAATAVGVGARGRRGEDEQREDADAGSHFGRSTRGTAASIARAKCS